ncbi:hypothetical protein D910_08581 [Dendroctonus ponderosae]|uniref:Uncharacterized protein n=1 Tax=Dendroctonus ponderosae TaxID=77166 RepID=U4UM52_DENPD|nr:hypothetical protein D910_08581 [Dendroctonus ponderosae]KAH1019516.1 hypothetical protein HUJ04_009324 [Dendroctonus ponderosae]
MDWFIGKTRRKEKEGADSSSSTDSKLYLESKVLERKLPEMDLKILVDLPAGLDYNETYLWFDEKGKKTKVAAPQYIDYVMTFIQKTISDETIFPTKYANEFPVSFESIVRKIVRLLYHVVAHLYAAHFKEVLLLGLHSHLNLTFAHLMALHHRFTLIDPKETDILEDLEMALGLNQEAVEAANNNEERDRSEDSRSQSTEDTCGDNKS